MVKKSKRHATKKRRLRVVVSQPLKKKRSHQIRALSFETTRKEEEEEARERVLSLLRAVLRVKEIERCDFWFLPFVFVRLCLRVVSGERERESDDDGVSVVCGRLSLFPFFVVQSKRRKIEHENEQSYCF